MSLKDLQDEINSLNERLNSERQRNENLQVTANKQVIEVEQQASNYVVEEQNKLNEEARKWKAQEELKAAKLQMEADYARQHAAATMKKVDEMKVAQYKYGPGNTSKRARPMIERNISAETPVQPQAQAPQVAWLDPREEEIPSLVLLGSDICKAIEYVNNLD